MRKLRASSATFFAGCLRSPGNKEPPEKTQSPPAVHPTPPTPRDGARLMPLIHAQTADLFRHRPNSEAVLPRAGDFATLSGGQMCNRGVQNDVEVKPGGPACVLMRALKVIACVVCILLVVGWLVLSFAARAPSSDRFALAQLGVTNDPTGARRAVMGFTNQSKSSTVRISACVSEARSGATPDPYSSSNFMIWALPTVGPGQSTVFSIPAPPEGTWRATARGFRTGWRLRLYNQLCFSGYPAWLQSLFPRSVYFGHRLEVESAWIEP
jgi:hypothetical protein